MKKFFFIVAASMFCLAANAAYTLNNPIGEDGRYIVKYDCENGSWATSNDMEVDETFVWAIDVTGSWLADWLKATPAAEGASRGVAINFWTNYGDTNGDVRRFKQIEGNIWGMTVNFSQIMNGVAVGYDNCVMTDSITYIYAQIFGFEYTESNAGAGWWMWDVNEVDVTQADGSDCLFAFKPYTGTKSSPAFYGDDFTESMYGFALGGYAAPCVYAQTALTDIHAEKNAIKTIEDNQLILIKDGIRYNVLGIVIK